MAQPHLQSAIVSPARPPWPGGTPVPLENGDRLGRGEFERRYVARPDIHKAELIEGVVHVSAPVRATSHGRPSASMAGWRVYDKAVAWFVLEDDEFQPRSSVGGVCESPNFPGLRLAVDALLADDGANVLAELREGMEQPEHAEFVAWLQHEHEPTGRNR